jgi:hypothetical protein
MFDSNILVSWFYGKDIIIDLLGAIILLFLVIFAFRYYKLNTENKKFLWFSASMGLLFISYLFEILTHIRIYITDVEEKHIGAIVYTYNTIEVANLPVYIGYFGYRFLTLLGFYLLYSIYYKEQKKSNFFFVGYLLVLATMLSFFNICVFFITAIIILTMIIVAYFKIAPNCKDYKTNLIGVSFILLLLSYLISIFTYKSELGFVSSEIIQLFAFLLLLFTFIKVLIDGKKKRKN